MGLLKKFGQIVLKGVEIATGITPFIQGLIPAQYSGVTQTVTNDLQQIAEIIQDVEVFGQALGIAGPDKLKAAAPAVAQIILKSSLLANHKIANPELFNQGCSKIADGMADILNSLEDNVSSLSKKA